MNVGPALGGIGMAQETPSVEDAEAQVKKAVAVVLVAQVRARDTKDVELRAFRALVLTDALGEATRAAYAYQHATARAAMALLKTEPAAE